MPVDRDCSVRGCGRKAVSNRELTFFGFPKDPDLIIKWKENLRMLGADSKKLHYVCSLHFEESAMGSKRLKVNAVPTLNLGYEEAPPHTYFNIAKRSCCITTCRSQKRILYEFPKNDIARNIWAVACKLPLSDVAKKEYYICEHHFEKIYMSTKRVLDEAFPKFHIGPEDDEVVIKSEVI